MYKSLQNNSCTLIRKTYLQCINKERLQNASRFLKNKLPLYHKPVPVKNFFIFYEGSEIYLSIYDIELSSQYLQ